MEDYTQVTQAMISLARKVVSGEKIEKYRYRVTLEVPEEIGKAFEEIAEQQGTSVNDLLGKLASTGLDAKLQEGLAVTSPIVPKPAASPEDLMSQ